MASFAAELAATLAPFADVDFPGICNTRAAADEAVAGFERTEKDLIIVLLLTYAPSHIARPGLVRTRLPILLHNAQRLEGSQPPYHRAIPPTITACMACRTSSRCSCGPAARFR